MKRRRLFFLAAFALLALAGTAPAQTAGPEDANRYTVFIHQGGSTDAAKAEKDLKAVQIALARRGYLVRPPDNAHDDAGGAGVDYFAEGDKDIALDIATAVNDIIYHGQDTLHPRLQRIRNPPGYIGVWLYGKSPS